MVCNPGLAIDAAGCMAFHFRPASHEEAQVAFEPLASLSLARIEAQGYTDLSVIAPNNATWQRIRRVWGDPCYLITAVSPSRKNMYCFSKLGLGIQLETGSDSVALEAASEPLYGYSADCQSYGVRFQAP